ncbi:inner membrane-spanning protein YciB [Sphingomonas solaris]|uniref:Inner membrane-spanning protein YciB n=1 Tax=Alterirhizorhabdus solaris TaxID=2529389 RepID=A0A558QZI7_9SPHN|nr:inner membrane-spanning protein YciB [Sphingomonas solaris]TVV72529.1 septation protein IspZ [Sphingomonas solaris]
MTTSKREVGAVTRLLLDLGPLLAFLIAYWVTKEMFLSTGIFMAATLAAIIGSRLTAGHVSPLLWFSGFMVLVLGGLTIWLHDETFIKIKPTIYYLMVAAILAFGLWTKRPTLKLVLGTAYPGLTEHGWALLSRNWALFFVAMAVANEAVWRNTTTDFWLGYKLWGAMPATVLFALANIPMLMKHGMNAEVEAKEGPPLPPQG